MRLQHVRLRTAITVSLLYCGSQMRAQPAKPADPKADRLLAVSKVWVTVKYFHPYLAYRDIDWDKALVEALPKIRRAETEVEYSSAVGSMLGALHDPATYVRPRSADSGSASLDYETQPDNTLVVSNAPGPNSSHCNSQEAERLRSALENAPKAILFDQRLKAASSTDLLSLCLEERGVADRLITTEVDSPGQRTWIHTGLPPYSGLNEANYHSAFSVQAGRNFKAVAGAQKHKIIFLLGENSRLSTVASALFAAGEANVVTQSPHYQMGGGETVTIPLGETTEAVISLSEPVCAGGAALPEIPSLKDVKSTLLSNLNASPASKMMVPAYPEKRVDLSHASEPFPSAELRILAAYKIWGVFRYFFAYRDLMDEDWDDVFSLFLPVIDSAKDAQEYNLAVAEMVSHVFDSQAIVQSPKLTQYFGVAPVALRLRIIDGKPMVTQILNQEALEAGVKVGDIVTKVDGEDITVRAKRLTRYISWSTQQWLGCRLMETVLNGPDESIAAVSIQDGNGNPHEIQLKRRIAYSSLLEHQRDGDVTKVLAGNIGYVDLDRLGASDVDAMFDKFKETRAIIFDLRGSSRDTAGLIASRLTDSENVAAAIVTGPWTNAPDLPVRDRLTQSWSYFSVQSLQRSNKFRYKGQTVALVDERTMGAAEHTALFLEAANKTAFIGTSSAGADGDVTNFVVPGGIVVSFSGSDVRHGNTGKLQRVGIQPNVTVAPTVGGVRKGRDEVLEKSIEYLSHNGGVAAGFN